MNHDFSIEISNLQFQYPKNLTPTLSIEKLQINKGEKVFIYGSSGLGKSTLLNLISGVLVAKNGSVRVLDYEMASLSALKRDQLRGEHIGYIFQIFNLLPYLSIKENIQLPCLINKNRNAKKNASIQADELIASLGLSAYSSMNVSELSIGQQQRVAAARALIGSPSIIIADEPTSSLDEKNTTDFMNLLINEWEKNKFTLVFVSHDLNLAKYFDRSISLEKINKA